MVFSAFIGPHTEKLGGRWFSALGLSCLSLSCFLYSNLTQHSSYFDIIIRLVIAGAGMGLSMTCIMSSMIRNVPIDKVGVTSGVNNMARTLGMVLGVAILVTIFNSAAATQMSKAREEAINFIKNDKVFDQRASQGIILSLKSGNGNQEKLSDIVKIIDTKEKEAVKIAPASVRAKIIKDFDIQKRETSSVWYSLQNSYIDHMVKAFSHTFRWGALLILPGVIFALYSDRKRSAVLSSQIVQ